MITTSMRSASVRGSEQAAIYFRRCRSAPIFSARSRACAARLLALPLAYSDRWRRMCPTIGLISYSLATSWIVSSRSDDSHAEIDPCQRDHDPVYSSSTKLPSSRMKRSVPSYAPLLERGLSSIAPGHLSETHMPRHAARLLLSRCESVARPVQRYSIFGRLHNAGSAPPSLA